MKNVIPPSRRWEEFLVTVKEEGMEIPMCGLCGNSGIIDTTETAITPRGSKVGRKFYCICPNGRAMKGDGDNVVS